MNTLKNNFAVINAKNNFKLKIISALCFVNLYHMYIILSRIDNGYLKGKIH